MKITFYSNYLSHHQLPFCVEMYKKLGDDFKFVSCEPIKQERVNLGYEDLNKMYPFVIETCDGEVNTNLAKQLSTESDIVIHGSAPEQYIKERMRRDKITFRFLERIFKKGAWHIFSPRALFNMVSRHTVYRHKPLYVLCSSAYTAYDVGLVRAYKNKCYKWGYFPETKQYSEFDVIINNKKENSLLWAGRLIDWKHPEKAIYVAKKLKEEGINFELNIIGTGALEEKLKKMIKDYDLTDKVHMLGAMSPQKVREYMESTNVFLFTSDFNEGWGAVLNEAMNSGCAIVASHAIGSVPFLINHNINGLVYDNDDFNDLYNNVLYLMENPNITYEIGKKAYKTMVDEWNATVAAERFISLCKDLTKRHETSFENGPCSRAEKIKNNWFTEKRKNA